MALRKLSVSVLFSFTFSFLFVFFLSLGSVYSACSDGAVLEKVVFSLNDPTFSQNYDGTLGIIEVIERYDDFGIPRYSLWQTSNLASRDNYSWNGASATNYKTTSNNIAVFNVDSDFNDDRNNLLILNDLSDNFDLYYNVTFKNTGTCDGNNEAWLLNYNNNRLIKYYGIGSYSSYFKYNSISPNANWRFDYIPTNGLESQVFRVRANNLVNYGLVEIPVGPQKSTGSPHFQEIFARFWVDGVPAVCGDNRLDYGEQCDGTLGINPSLGEACGLPSDANACKKITCDDNIQVESITFSLDDEFHSQDYNGSSGIIQKIMWDESSDKFSLWQSPNVDYVTKYPWGPNSATISYNNYDIRNDISMDSSFNSKKKRVLIINDGNSDNFNLYYNITLKNTGSCNFNDDSIVHRRYGHILSNYGSSNFWNYKYNTKQPPHWYPSNINAGEIISKNYQVSNKDLINYGRLELRVGPHDNHRKYGEKHYQYFNAYFFVNLSAPYCGNGIKETGESCDGAAGVDTGAGEVCSLSCTIIPPTIPTIKWESHKTPEELWQGRNLSPGDSINLLYSANNTAGIDYDIRFDSMLYTVPFSNQPYDYYYNHNNLHFKYFNFFKTESVFTRGKLDELRQIISVPAGNTIYFNRTFVIPDLGSEYQNVIERFLVYERFKYKKSTDVSFRFPKLSSGAWNYYWWRSTSEMVSNSKHINDANVQYYNSHSKYDDYLSSPWKHHSWDGYWTTRGAGLGAYNPLYSISNLKSHPNDLSISVSDSGIVSVETIYKNGVVRSTSKSDNSLFGITEIPANTFYLDAQLILESTGEIISQRDILINESFSKSGGKNINYRETTDFNLQIMKRIIFPLFDFRALNGEEIRFNVTPKLVRTNQTLHSGNTFLSDKYYVNLDKPVAISVDSPIIIRPNGAGAFDNLFQRVLLFNYLEYAIFNPVITIGFENTGEEDVSHLYTYDFVDIDIIPAQSSYPLGVNIKYIGPTSGQNYLDHLMNFKIEFFDPSIGGQVVLERDTELKVLKNSIAGTFSDLIPVNLGFTLLNKDDISTIYVEVKNQGTNDVTTPFDVKFYIGEISAGLNFSDVDYNLLGSKTINSLDSGEVETVNVTYIPDKVQNIAIKVVVDEADDIFEDFSVFPSAEENNILTSIAGVRDLDVVLEDFEILYNESKDGIIPIKVFARNKILGGGGIDSYELKIKMYGETENYTQSHLFYQIPEAGIDKMFYIDVNDMVSGLYKFDLILTAPFDPDLSDNTLTGIVHFCPLPWYKSPIVCESVCKPSCLDTVLGRYLGTCHGVNGCMFKDETTASLCNGFLDGSYVPVNSTHEVLCPDASITRLGHFTNTTYKISGNCKDFIVIKIPKIFQRETVLMNIISCVE
jgi:hypothetical protein